MTFAGADTIDKLIQNRDLLIEALASAKISLGKWSGNNKRVLGKLPNVEVVDRPLNTQEITSTLGFQWSPVHDHFFFKERTPEKPTEHVITKRTALSKTAKLFDPLDWVSPVLVSFKIFLQDL